MKWLKKLFKIHEHHKELFLVGRIAFVKCVTCGAESIPWEVPQRLVEDCAHRKDDVKKLIEIDKSLKDQP